MDISIVRYKAEFQQAFFDFNIEWLETYFYVEDYDKEVLGDPVKYILDPGGEIFFAVEAGIPIGTVALMPYAEGVYELTKMAVPPAYRGMKIGQKLMQHCIDFARDKGFNRLLLYSNTVLENAIYIYRKFGFKEVEMEKDRPYDRGNIKMLLHL